MTDTTPSAAAGESINELRALRERKEALQNAIRIAKAINRLQKGLNAVLLMGNSSAKIPKHAVRFYSELSAEIRHKPANVLQADVIELDRRVRADFEKILSLARGDAAAVGGAESAGFESISTQRLVDDFRRRAQTAVCLRIALRERGVSAAPFALSVPEDIVRSHIATLEQKEQQHKQKIRANIIVMREDVEKMLAHPAFPDAMKQDLHRILDGLRQDIEHIDSGKDIDELPFHVETVVEETAPAAPVNPKPRPAAPAATNGPPPQRSMFALFWDWLNTPWNVTWKQLAKRDAVKKANTSRRPQKR